VKIRFFFKKESAHLISLLINGVGVGIGVGTVYYP